MSIAFLDEKCKAGEGREKSAPNPVVYTPYSSRIGHFVILILCLAFSLSVGLYKLKMMGVRAMSEVKNQATAADSVVQVGEGDAKKPVHIIDRGEAWRYQP